MIRSTKSVEPLHKGPWWYFIVTCETVGVRQASQRSADRIGAAALKCTDAVYSRSRSYSVSMNFPAPLSLHHYFVVAARMQHHFESNLVAVEESGVAALQDPDLAAFELFSGPRGNFMYYWYASLCVVVQGFRNLKLVDPRVDALLASPNVKALRRCWNGVFHFQPDYFSAKLLEPMQAPDFIGWVRELMEAFRAYFAREIKPVES